MEHFKQELPNHSIKEGITPVRRIEYHPPEPEVIEAYAWQVCQALGEAYNSVEVVRGLAAFIQAIASAQAKLLNCGRGHLLDNERSSV